MTRPISIQSSCYEDFTPEASYCQYVTMMIEQNVEIAEGPLSLVRDLMLSGI